MKAIPQKAIRFWAIFNGFIIYDVYGATRAIFFFARFMATLAYRDSQQKGVNDKYYRSVLKKMINLPLSKHIPDETTAALKTQFFGSRFF